MMNDERSLADEPTGTSTEVQRGPLSTDEFLSGVRAQRRSVRIRPNLHLLAEMERIVEEIDTAPAGADVDELLDTYDTTRDDFLHSERWVVEQRTPERRRHVRREAGKALGIELHDNGEGPVEDDADRTNATALEAHVIADHIVEPAGATEAHVRALYAASPGEYRKIDHAVVQVQRVLDEASEQAVLRDFSSRRSGKTQRSSKH